LLQLSGAVVTDTEIPTGEDLVAKRVLAVFITDQILFQTDSRSAKAVSLTNM